jgi:hypothetical protein
MDMAIPHGQWHIDVKGFKGTLNITTNNNFVSGSIDIDVGFTDTLQGTWDEDGQEIVFNRVLTRQGKTFVQTYIGYQFSTKDPIFAGQGVPEPDPNFRLLTGYFLEAEGFGAAPGHPRSGWVARQAI